MVRGGRFSTELILEVLLDREYARYRDPRGTLLDDEDDMFGFVSVENELDWFCSVWWLELSGGIYPMQVIRGDCEWR